MFITAVCVLFLIKLRWPNNKSLYDTVLTYSSFNSVNFNTIAKTISLRSNVVFIFVLFIFHAIFYKAGQTEKQKAIPLCLPNNINWDPSTSEIHKTKATRSFLCPVPAAVEMLTKIKGTTSNYLRATVCKY